MLDNAHDSFERAVRRVFDWPFRARKILRGPANCDSDFDDGRINRIGFASIPTHPKIKEEPREMNIESATQVVQHAAQHEEAKELPNIITLLNQFFPHSLFAHFLERWENIVFALSVALLICATAIWAASQKKIIPEGIQNFWEMIVEGIYGFVTGILGDAGKEHVAFLGTLFVYILLMNWCGLIPLLKAPTSSWSETIALALIVMVYIQYTGIRKQGFWNYLKHMAGSPANLFGILLIPIMLAINLTIELIAVPLSLSLRLFANISSEDMLIFKFAQLNVLFKGVPFFLQLFANVLAIAFSLVQAFVFMLLSTVYISLILPHESHEEEQHST